MKNKGLIITMIIILFIILAMLITFLCLALSGRFNFRFVFGTKSKKVIYDEIYKLEDIESIEVLSTAGDIKFEKSNDEEVNVVVYGENSNDCKISLNKGKLNINCSQKRNSFISFGGYLSDIIVYIPEDYDKDIKIDSDYGDINIIDLENASIDIDQSCGDIDLGKVKNIIIQNNYGDTKIEKVLNKVDVKSNCGDIKINSLDIKENSKITSDLGDIEIGETNDIYIDAKVDLGDIQINTNSRRSDIVLKIENDCGDIEVKN